MPYTNFIYNCPKFLQVVHLVSTFSNGCMFVCMPFSVCMSSWNNSNGMGDVYIRMYDLYSTAKWAFFSSSAWICQTMKVKNFALCLCVNNSYLCSFGGFLKAFLCFNNTCRNILFCHYRKLLTLAELCLNLIYVLNFTSVNFLGGNKKNYFRFINDSRMCVM